MLLRTADDGGEHNCLLRVHDALRGWLLCVYVWLFSGEGRHTRRYTPLYVCRVYCTITDPVFFVETSTSKSSSKCYGNQVHASPFC